MAQRSASEVRTKKEMAKKIIKEERQKVEQWVAASKAKPGQDFFFILPEKRKLPETKTEEKNK